MLEFFGEVFLIIGGVEHTLIFKALFLGFQHGVGERVSLRGAVFNRQRDVLGLQHRHFLVKFFILWPI